jgi:hypothetical protein
MPLTSSQEWTKWWRHGSAIAAKFTLLPPRVSGHSHSIVPGGFRRHVIHHAVDALDLIDDAGRGGAEACRGPEVRPCQVWHATPPQMR